MNYGLIASRLKEARKDKGLTLRQVEAATGIANENLSRYENARTGLSVGTLIKLCVVYGRSADYLLGFTDKER